jgi:uncharacterized protein (TIGR02996 family)
MLAPLLAEVIAEPRSIAPRRVYADALLEAGDPRGEFIQLQCALEELDADDRAAGLLAGARRASGSSPAPRCTRSRRCRAGSELDVQSLAHPAGRAGAALRGWSVDRARRGL